MSLSLNYLSKIILICFSLSYYFMNLLHFFLRCLVPAPLKGIFLFMVAIVVLLLVLPF
jgi:hypothetical protein